MDIYRELIFSYLEEDNTQRVYFRVKPLLAASGDVQEEARAAWPDEGALRIVPDRAEQYHFKDRMRTLGSFCVMDLTHTTEEANKIRTNKNYNPAKGECNQYILYSDAVQPLPAHSFFEVMSGKADDAAALSAAAVTPLFYIKDGDTLLGPVDRAQTDDIHPAEPAEGVLYDVVCPDGKTRAILCLPHMEAEKPQAEPMPVQPTASAESAAPMQKEPAAADEPVEQADAGKPHSEKSKSVEEDSLAIGQKLHILDESKGFEEQLSAIAQPLSKGANLLNASPSAHRVPQPVRSEPLSGTPLMRSNFRAATPKPKTQLQEVVSAQWRAARYEPPAAPLPAGATLQPVENPVEEACRCLTQAWKLPEAQQQLIDHVLSLPGIGQRLTHRGKSSGANETPLQAVLSARLQDMEAERLSALVELDKAKADVEQYKKTILEGLKSQKAQELSTLDQQLEERHASAQALQKQLTELTEQRDALQAEIDALQGEELPHALADALTKANMAETVTGTPLRLAPVPGTEVPPQELIARVQNGLHACGYAIAQPDVITLLTLLACCPRFSLVAPQLGPVVELIQNICAVCGWGPGVKVQETERQYPVLSKLPADATPAVLITALTAPAAAEPVHTVMIGKNLHSFSQTAAWEMSPWPLWQLSAIPAMTPMTNADAQPISATSLKQYASAHGATEEEITKCLAPMLEALEPLGIVSGTALAAMKQFIRVASAYMEGGLAAAMDRGLLLWLGALVSSGCELGSTIMNLVSEYPLTAAHLKK